MPSYASQLTTRERWAVVAYVKQLQTTPTIAPHAVDDSLRGLGIQQSDSAETAARRKS
jgi:hypothetical protein